MEWRAAPSPHALDDVRRHTAEVAGGAPSDAVYDAQTVAVELVTNAWLHGRPPVEFTVAVRDGAIVVEVADAGHGVPVVQPASDGATVGRGLRLVAALTSSWGVQSHGTGKSVWAHIPLDRVAAGDANPPDLDVDALLASWPDDEEPDLVAVRIEAAPLPLLVSSTAHIAEVVRELRLLLAGADDRREHLPPELVEMTHALQYDWGPGQQALHQQVEAARERGDRRVDVDLRFPVSAADACERFLTALDAADALSRAGRLLTREPPASEVAFRHWWVGTIAGQLRAHGEGRSLQAATSFAEVLAERVDELSVRAAAWDRLQVLQRVTAELADAGSIDEVARVVSENAAQHLGALAARVYVADDHGVLHSRGWYGRQGGAGDQFDSFAIDDDLPGAVVARTGRPMVLRHLDEIYETFPSLVGYYPSERSLLIHPVRAGERLLGLLGVTFASNAIEESEQRTFVQALADALAQALDRAKAVEQSEVRAERLRLVADASIALNASLDFQETVDAVTHVLVPRLADWAVVQVLRDGVLDNVSIHHPDPAKIAWVRSLEGRWPEDLAADTGSPAVIRTGHSEIYPSLPDELIEAGARDAEHLAALQALGMKSVMIVPLAGRSGIIGALTLIYAESGRHYGDDDLPLVEDIARRAAFAIETAETFRQQSGRLADVVQVAEAAQRAILADLPTRLGPVTLAATYRSSAAEATVGGDLFDAMPHGDGVRLLIGDVRGKGLAAVRTASLVLGAARAAADDLDTLAEVAADMDRRLRRHLTDEDFVTACLVEVGPGGSYSVVSAGHPPPLVFDGVGCREVDLVPSPPLGLGAAPVAATGRLAPGDRMLLFTDGLTEARTPTGEFVPIQRVVSPLVSEPLGQALDSVLERLTGASGSLHDDLALFAVEYDPMPRQVAHNSPSLTEADA